MTGGRRQFRILRVIAEGGFGRVYLAEQHSPGDFRRVVALKLLHTRWAAHDEVVQRTRDEARLLGLLRHANIVQVEDLTSIDGNCAIVMEYLDGVDLKSMSSFLVDRGLSFPRGALFEIAAAVASALDAAYNSPCLSSGSPLRVIHRDIKPANIILTRNGAVKLLDFGTSRAEFAHREAGTEALSFGSREYMAPERSRGELDAPSTDVFSLGVSLVELMRLEPFGGINLRPEMHKKIVASHLEALEVVDDVRLTRRVLKLLGSMLRYEPEKRPDAATVSSEFDQLAEEVREQGLRRFARATVHRAQDAKAQFDHLHGVLDANDPLLGQCVVEDATRPSMGGGTPRVQPDAPASLTVDNSDVSVVQRPGEPSPLAGDSGPDSLLAVVGRPAPAKPFVAATILPPDDVEEDEEDDPTDVASLTLDDDFSEPIVASFSTGDVAAFTEDVRDSDSEADTTFFEREPAALAHEPVVSTPAATVPADMPPVPHAFVSAEGQTAVQQRRPHVDVPLMTSWADTTPPPDELELDETNAIELSLGASEGVQVSDDIPLGSPEIPASGSRWGRIALGMVALGGLSFASVVGFGKRPATTPTSNAPAAVPAVAPVSATPTPDARSLGVVSDGGWSSEEPTIQSTVRVKGLGDVVELRGNGFRATLNADTPLTVPLVPGVYTARVPSLKVRGKSVVLPEGVEACTLTLDLEAMDWTSDCGQE
ncbi:MAG: serine/threonine-protein kinase [Myxococcota bacterium]